MSPDGGNDPSDDLKDAIIADFGGLEIFMSRFRKAATSQFGSGWVWRVRDAGNAFLKELINRDFAASNFAASSKAA